MMTNDLHERAKTVLSANVNPDCGCPECAIIRDLDDHYVALRGVLGLADEMAEAVRELTFEGFVPPPDRQYAVGCAIAYRAARKALGE